MKILLLVSLITIISTVAQDFYYSNEGYNFQQGGNANLNLETRSFKEKVSKAKKYGEAGIKAAKTAKKIGSTASEWSGKADEYKEKGKKGVAAAKKGWAAAKTAKEVGSKFSAAFSKKGGGGGGGQERFEGIQFDGQVQMNGGGLTSNSAQFNQYVDYNW